MRWLIILATCVSCVLAQGEKPVQPQDTAKNTGVQTGAAQQINEQKSTADDQYLWIIQTYDQAKRDGYEKSITRALLATEHFLKTYAADARVPTVYFYREQLFGLASDMPRQTEALAKYFSIAPTSNPVYFLARLDQAYIWERSGKKLEALKEYEEIYAVATGNTKAKDEALLHLVPFYEADQQWLKLKVIYTFFVEHPEKLPNQEMYYIYAYKLGVIYYNEGKKQEAAKYFAIVKSGTAPVLKLFKESIETKYK